METATGFRNGFSRLAAAICVLTMLSALTWLGLHFSHASAASSRDVRETGRAALVSPRQSVSSTTAYLPVVIRSFPQPSPFGVESNLPLAGGTILTRAIDLGAGWVRMNSRVSWRTIEPVQGDTYHWDLLASFEDELRALKAAGMTPVVILQDYPTWATIGTPWPTTCGAIRTDKFGAYAQFVRALVDRYKTPEFNVHNWELGNEPDVDPTFVTSPTNPYRVYGCWGDISDPYYGGRHYGEMLKVIAPAIKERDAEAKVWIGGLLLDTPNTTDLAKGKPERFFEGILVAGAASDFDIVPYHSYLSYVNQKVDHDNAAGGNWDSWGGNIVGKARYLRQVMSAYGVDKPVFADETGLMCPEQTPGCDPPGNAFYEMQADYVVRTFVRGLGEDVKGFVWYTLNGPGWRYTGLLDSNAYPRSVYVAYQQLNAQLKKTIYVGPANYGSGIEAYMFSKGAQEVDVAWAKQDVTYAVTIPGAEFVAAFDRYGAPVTPTVSGSDYHLYVGFDPVYIIRAP